MSGNVSYASSSPLVGAKGFGGIKAWKQEETWQFFLLQIVAVVFALIISFRDAKDRDLQSMKNRRRRRVA